MRIDFLIGSFVVIIIGLIISGMIGSLTLAVGIMFLLFTIFSRGEAREAEPARYVEPESPRYVEPEYYEEPPRQERKKTRPREYEEEPKPSRKRNVDRAERELREWSPGKSGKRCSHCGSTSNPSDARFCADCGSRL